MTAVVEPADLGDPLLVASAGERRVEERGDDALGLGHAGAPPAEGEDVQVVVFARQHRALDIDDRRRADAAHFVGGNRHPDAGAADENAAIEIAYFFKPEEIVEYPTTLAPWVAAADE